MAAPFRKLHHICIVVRDMEASVAYYESLGMGPWEPFPPMTDIVDLNMPDDEAFLAIEYRYLALENVVIQLCAPPPGASPQRAFLETRGEGVFQIGFESSLAAGEAEAAEVGLSVLMSGRRTNGTGFTYFDTLDDTGVVWMIRQTVPDRPSE